MCREFLLSGYVFLLPNVKSFSVCNVPRPFFDTKNEDEKRHTYPYTFIVSIILHIVYKLTS